MVWRTLWILFPMQRDQWVSCEKGKITGAHFSGGFAEYMISDTEALARLPEGMTYEEAGPLMCAGLTTFNALKQNPAKAGQVVVVIGVGGLGHLGIQYANKLGYRVVAVSSGKDKEALAKKLGAHHYFDGSNAAEAVAAIKKLGGAHILLATAPSAKAVEDLIPSLAVLGKVIILAAIMEPLKLNTTHMLMGRNSVVAWASGDARDAQATLEFSQMTGVKPMVDIYPLDKAAEAYQAALSNKPRFRVVIKID